MVEDEDERQWLDTQDDDELANSLWPDLTFVSQGCGHTNLPQAELKTFFTATLRFLVKCKWLCLKGRPVDADMKDDRTALTEKRVKINSLLKPKCKPMQLVSLPPNHVGPARAQQDDAELLHTIKTYFSSRRPRTIGTYEVFQGAAWASSGDGFDYNSPVGPITKGKLDDSILCQNGTAQNGASVAPSPGPGMDGSYKNRHRHDETGRLPTPAEALTHTVELLKHMLASLPQDGDISLEEKQAAYNSSVTLDSAEGYAS